MANVSHVTLTGTEVHEPKGVDTADLGEVYVADGNGSGNWANVGTSSFTGMIADFTWPVVQNGWLELDGSDVNTTTFSALYDVMTIQMTGTRVSGNPTITSLSSTANMRVGYYVFGVGIAAGTTILSINSGTQITLSGNAGSSGTATVVVSPWYLDNGTIRLPDTTSAGRFRRSRASTTAVGQSQSSMNVAHSHQVNGTTGNQSVQHTHGVSGVTGAMSANANHSHGVAGGIYGGVTVTGVDGGGLSVAVNDQLIAIQGANIDHTHTLNTTSGVESTNHTHSFSVASNNDGGTETRPMSLVVMTCVKT